MARFTFLPMLLGIMAVSVSTAAVMPEDYWKNKLPNTQIPGALRELLVPGLVGNMEGVIVGEGGVHVDAGSTRVNVGRRGVSVNTGRRRRGTRVGVGNDFIYNYAATEAEILSNRDITLFFEEKDLRSGKTMNLQLARTSSSGPFLPRSIANAIPFSSQKLSQVIDLFSLKPESPEVEDMKKTLHTCESPAAKGETRFCATSLESMIDLSTAYLKTNDVTVISSEVSREDTPKQPYTITPNGVEKLRSSEAVACHAQPFAYSVFYCHLARATHVYLVSLKGEDGAKVKAVTVCHLDTSNWNPGHLAFQVLKVKPGSVPICHFLPQDHIIWAPRR
ncbi:BURP domain-containing protein 3-like [Wolffia australiana]